MTKDLQLVQTQTKFTDLFNMSAFGAGAMCLAERSLIVSHSSQEPSGRADAEYVHVSIHLAGVAGLG